MSKIKRIDHVAIVVEDIENALTFWRDTLGLELDHIEEVPSQQAEIAFLPTGGSEIELVRPTTIDSGIAQYLNKRGEGMHHICLEVDDIDGAIEELKAKSVRLIYEEAVEVGGGKRMTFIHPKSANGVLVELYELPQ